MPTLKKEKVHKQIGVYGKVEDLHPEVSSHIRRQSAGNEPQLPPRVLQPPSPAAPLEARHRCPSPAWKQRAGKPGPGFYILRAL